MDYRAEGMVPEALVNYLALLGWNPGDEREYFSLVELVAEFSLEKVQKSSAAWNREKLLSVNQHWMRALSDDAFLAHLEAEPPSRALGGSASKFDSEILRRAVPLLKERARTFGEAREMLDGELSCLFNALALDRKKLLAKELADRPETAKNGLQGLLKLVEGLGEAISSATVKEILMPLADEAEARGKGDRGAVLWALRYALSGQERSPDPFTLISILGPRESAMRVRNAIGILEK